jgi:hypothetical protein
MTFLGSPFSVEGIRRGLDPGQRAADSEAGRQQQSALDKAELRDLERAQYKDATSDTVESSAPATTLRKGILDRLLRR